ncbi:FAD-binding protein, partial [Klebsiella variicola]|uniref:FAD-binding protein n=1 Tax=Klebsiella variicola TaxID=244366 RepID=UPI00272F5CD8
MLEQSVGESISESYGPMISSWLGHNPEFSLEAQPKSQPRENFRVVVIGAGVAGICAGIRLQAAGIPFVILEKND